MIDLNTVHEYLREFIAEAGSQSAAAELLGVSAPYLNDVYHGKRDPGPAIINGLGLRRVVMFEQVGDVSDRVVKNLRP